MYKGIQMRSRLEADYAGSRERDGVVVKYERKCFASEEGQWLVDFSVDGYYVELKPAGLFEDHLMGLDSRTRRPCIKVDDILKKMAIAHASEPNAPLALIYWEFGSGAIVTIDCQGHGCPWTVQYKDMPFPALWTGMGQWDRCCGSVTGG